MKFPTFACLLAVFVLWAQVLPGKELPPVEVLKELTPADTRNQEVVAKTRRLLKNHDTEGLEALAAELRVSKETGDGGTWILSNFYTAAVAVPEDEPEAGEAMEFYERWARERPESITAQVCLAEALTTYAWNARGGGWASTVTKEGWRLFRERLARSWDVLERAGKLREKCPGWYEAAQTIALGQGWDRDRYRELVDEAIGKEPTYGRYYTKACYWLLPRWYGEEGDFERWIASRADAYPPDKSDWQYARFVWMADRNFLNGEMVFQPGRLDWGRTKRGFGLWLQAMPDNLNVRFEFMRLALLADDRETLREQFDITGGKYFPPVLGRKVEDFEKARAFAYSGGPNPFLTKERGELAGPKLSPEALQMVKLCFRLAGGFIGGMLVGVCLLGLALQRRQIWAGVIAALVAVGLALLLGTAATVPAGLGLWLYFHRKHFEHPPPLRPISGWMTLLWVVVLMVLSVGLQLGASIIAAIPLFLEHGIGRGEEVMNSLMADGSALLFTLNAFWIGFLLLLVICRPQNRAGWQERLGLHSFRPVPAMIWVLLASVAAIGLGIFLEPFMDVRSKQAMEYFTRMKTTPILFFLTVGILGPIYEELVFRGFAFAGWIQKMGFWGTASLTSVIFTASHIQYGWVALAWVLVFGFTLATLRWKTGSIYPSIAVHMINNLMQCVLVVLGP